jgi:hypothetical protein
MQLAIIGLTAIRNRRRINIFTHYVEELHASVKGGTEHHEHQ